MKVFLLGKKEFINSEEVNMTELLKNTYELYARSSNTKANIYYE